MTNYATVTHDVQFIESVFRVSWYSSTIPYFRDGEPLTRGSDPLAHFSDPLAVWKTLLADVITFFFLFTQFWAKNWSSANLFTFFLVFIRFWAENWSFADVVTFFCSTPDFGRKIGHLRT